MTQPHVYRRTIAFIGSRVVCYFPLERADFHSHAAAITCFCCHSGVLASADICPKVQQRSPGSSTVELKSAVQNGQLTQVKAILEVEGHLSNNPTGKKSAKATSEK